MRTGRAAGLAAAVTVPAGAAAAVALPTSAAASGCSVTYAVSFTVATP